MAKAKAVAKPKTWTVVANGQEFIIDAARVDVTDGVLVLSEGNGGALLHAWAEGAWSSIAARNDIEGAPV